MFKAFTDWLKGRLHIRPTELKGTPGVHDAAAAAAHANAAVGALIDAEAANLPAAAANALKLHPNTLKGAPGISDHAAAAEVINAVVAAKLGE